MPHPAESLSKLRQMPGVADATLFGQSIHLLAADSIDEAQVCRELEACAIAAGLGERLAAGGEDDGGHRRGREALAPVQRVDPDALDLARVGRHKVDKKLGSKKREMDAVAIRKACRAYAEGFIDVQREQFRRLGVGGLWQHPYTTMGFGYDPVFVPLGEARTFAEHDPEEKHRISHREIGRAHV